LVEFLPDSIEREGNWSQRTIGAICLLIFIFPISKIQFQFFEAISISNSHLIRVPVTVIDNFLLSCLRAFMTAAV